MSLFPRTFISDDPTSFHPLFRLLDDFDSYSKSNTPSALSHNHRRGGNIMKSFTPKFDVKEVTDAYELHGELPGIEQSNVEIEFSDSQTLVIRGHTERSYTSGTPPASIEAGKTTEQITEGKAKQPTVEDEDAAGSTSVAKKEAAGAPEEPQEKYWVSERSVGEFSRSFTFPVRVDSEAVKASMKNGILSIVVPKAKKEHTRKITIS